ncbi:t-cell surface glycoprotein cd3 epsilon chain [Lynx pardinus]|uniref:T-cell surface glycoprotein CD3 epsilon chain n=1 Tax=Lynx pardinus TaxID=191816 RepID=A0A485NGT5_LYNPA|nr:t-cell surface glycoprotein cd3 epsilon chain [Lynx pardinus]
MMPSGSLWRVLGLCLLSAGPQEGKEERYKVSISGTTVVLTCPEDLGSESIKWEKNGGLLPNEYGEQLFLDDFSEMENSGYYACYTSNSLEKNYLYLKARGQNKEKPPPVPNPDYEPIRKGQQDLYSGLNQRGI